MPRKVAAIAVALAAACAASRGSRPSPLLGTAVEVAAPDLEGAAVRVGDDGARVRVVDFWASWCEPCREQLPALDRLHEAYGARGLTVYAVSFDQDRAQVEAFLEHAPLRLTVLWDKGGERLAGPLAVDRLPTTLVLDRAGVVRYARSGYGPDHLARLEDEVRKLLAP
jgi:thiol-disulfide isomerase/thioredoxin